MCYTKASQLHNRSSAKDVEAVHELALGARRLRCAPFTGPMHVQKTSPAETLNHQLPTFNFQRMHSLKVES